MRKQKRFEVDRKLIDLSVLWLKNELTYSEFCRQIGKPVHSNIYIQLARALKVAYRSKLLK